MPVVLIDNGAKLETPAGSIGTQLDNASGYACWHATRLLVASDAAVHKLWHAAALRMLERIEQLREEQPATASEISQAFWHACAANDAPPNTRSPDEPTSTRYPTTPKAPLDAATSLGARQASVLSWLRERGATSTKRA